MIYYILTHLYYDSSGFSVHGLTTNKLIAIAWDRGNDENHVYEGKVDVIGDEFVRWLKGAERK